MVYVMSKNPNFNLGYSDLGTDTHIGLDKASVDNSLLYSANELPTQCYACTAPNPSYQVLAIKPIHETAQIQNGLYICTHCLGQNILDRTIYGIRDLR